MILLLCIGVVFISALSSKNQVSALLISLLLVVIVDINYVVVNYFGFL
jgi:hypothetical protein